MAFASLKTTETDTLRIQMIQRGLTVELLAAQCGVERKTLSNQISKNVPSRRLRLILEDALKLPLWTALADFDSRQKLSSVCGFDPLAASVPDLRQKISALKIRGRSRSRKKKILIEMLQNHFAKQTLNPNHPCQKT